MKLISPTRRVVLSALAVVAIVGATVATRHANEGHDVAANTVAPSVCREQPVETGIGSAKSPYS